MLEHIVCHVSVEILQGHICGMYTSWVSGIFQSLDHCETLGLCWLALKLPYHIWGMHHQEICPLKTYLVLRWKGLIIHRKSIQMSSHCAFSNWPTNIGQLSVDDHVFHWLELYVFLVILKLFCFKIVYKLIFWMVCHKARH